MSEVIQKQYGDVVLSSISAKEPEKWDVEGATHVRVSLPADIKNLVSMQEMGYQFVDRMYDVTINLKRNKLDLDKCIRIQPQPVKDYRDEIKELAVASFETDRRFHVEVNYNTDIAKQIIEGWVNEIPEFYVCRNKDNVIGFLALEEDEEGKSASIHLAAVDKKYRTSGAALSLYANALKVGIERGYQSITGYISSCNTAVINLYSYLGGTFSNPTDIYLKK